MDNKSGLTTNMLIKRAEETYNEKYEKQLIFPSEGIDGELITIYGIDYIFEGSTQLWIEQVKENKEYVETSVAYYFLSMYFENVCACKKDKTTMEFTQGDKNNNPKETLMCHRCGIVYTHTFEDNQILIRRIDAEADELIKQIKNTYPIIEGGLDHLDISKLLIGIVQFVRRNHK